MLPAHKTKISGKGKNSKDKSSSSNSPKRVDIRNQVRTIVSSVGTDMGNWKEFFGGYLGEGSLDASEISIWNAIRELAEISKIIADIAPESIFIFCNDPTSPPKDPNFNDLYSRGTKVIDAIIYQTIVQMRDSTQKQAWLTAFKFESGTPEEVDKKYPSLLTASMLLIYLTRGYIPNPDSTIPLPKMVLALLKSNNTVLLEKDLALELSTTNVSNFNLESALDDNSMGGFNEFFVKRMKLSIAGHKPLKCALRLETALRFALPGHEDETCGGIVKTLLDKSENGNLYKTLHPAFGKVQIEAPEYYKNCLYAIFKVLGENVTLIRNTNMFELDPFVGKDDKAGIFTYMPTYESWDLDKVEAAYGVPWKLV